MSKVTIIKTADEMPAEPILAHIRRFLFDRFTGWTEADKKGWRKIWKRLNELEPGEFAQIEFVIPRNPRFHRKFFALLKVGFDAWDFNDSHKMHDGKPITKNFEAFREDVLILAGFYEQTFDIHGNMKLKAKSISFSAMDDHEFEAVYSAVADVLLAHVLTAYSSRDELDLVVMKIMEFA